MAKKRKKPDKAQLNGSEALVQALCNEGVEYIFGYPGGAVLFIYDYFVKEPRLRHILVRHEQVAAHMAEGYARASGKVGVCMATSGPGATNLTTGIADAMLDSVPILAITGQVPTHAIGSDAFQEADTFGITLPIVKHNYIVKDVTTIPELIHQALYIARSGRPGPVLIDFPKNISQEKHLFQFDNFKRNFLEGYHPPKKSSLPLIKKASQMIAEAKQPILYAGGGIISSGASQILKQVAEKTKMPVTTTLMGLGGFPGTHPQFLGMVGMHGTVPANYAINKSDLIFAVGVRFDDRVTGNLEKFAPQAKVIHIDIDESEIHKIRYANLPLLGDAKSVLKQMLPWLKKPKHLSPWWKQIKEWRQTYPLRYKTDGELKPQWVIEELYRFFKKHDPIVVTGVGQHQMWTALYFKFDKPNRFISSGGLGTMGFGFPAAMGAQVAKPNKIVLCIDGDGSFQMVSQDLATCVVNRFPLKIFIMNNQYLGMVRQWQELFFGKRYSSVCLSQTLNCDPWCNQPGPDKCPSPTPDFVKLAEAYGAIGLRVTRQEELEKVMQRCLQEQSLPVVVDLRITEEENVYPMIPAGQSVNEIIPCP